MFPDNSAVVFDTTNSGYTQVRGFSSLILTRSDTAKKRTGIFRCAIPHEGILSNLYIGLYDNIGDGKISLCS